MKNSNETPEEILKEKERYEKAKKEDFGAFRNDLQLPGEQDPLGAREQREKQQRIRTDIEQARVDFERDRDMLENIKAKVWQKGIDALMREKNQSEPVPLVDVLDWKGKEEQLRGHLQGLKAGKHIDYNNIDDVLTGKEKPRALKVNHKNETGQRLALALFYTWYKEGFIKDFEYYSNDYDDHVFNYNLIVDTFIKKNGKQFVNKQLHQVKKKFQPKDREEIIKPLLQIIHPE